MNVGERLADRYRLDRPIGSGGMGQVWAGRDTVLERDVAIKVQPLDPEAPPAELERFIREARATAALQHPHVVTIFDSGTNNGQAFLVMELLPGPSLQAYVTERGPLPEAEAVALGAQIASGLAAAHEAGLVHRDIKPSNVMFDALGKAKIVDFGIARLAESTATGLTITNAVIGSPPYLSPEQYRGEAADERSDLYALGCVLTTLLTGRPPFEAEHPLAYGHQHVHAAPPAVSDRRPDVSPALDALVRQTTQQGPAGSAPVGAGRGTAPDGAGIIPHTGRQPPTTRGGYRCAAFHAGATGVRTTRRSGCCRPSTTTLADALDRCHCSPACSSRGRPALRNDASRRTNRKPGSAGVCRGFAGGGAAAAD